MSKRKSTFERDRAIAGERYPKDAQRLETLRAGFDSDFDSAFHLAREEGQLIAWVNGTHILAYQPGVSPIGLHLRLHTKAKQVTDLGIVGKLDCPLLVEVVYERQDQTHRHIVGTTRPRADCQQERRADSKQEQRERAQLPIGHYDELAYWGRGDYFGDPPTPPPGAILLPKKPGSDQWQRRLENARR